MHILILPFATIDRQKTYLHACPYAFVEMPDRKAADEVDFLSKTRASSVSEEVAVGNGATTPRMKQGPKTQVLAQFRQRRARLDGQNPHKKPKKKKTSSSKNDVHGLNIDQSKSEEMVINSSQGVGSAVMPESTIMRTLNNEEMLKHEQVFCVDPESEISTTADDFSSEVNDCCNVVKTGKPTNLLMEEEFGVVDSYSEQGAHYSETHLELIENELVGKPEHEPKELNRELEEMRTTYGTKGLHQLQEFEAAVKQRDSIITQLTANLQQARRERDKTVREFVELMEQSQKLQIQFQQLQASETLRNSTHSNTAADLLQAKQQILIHQQQVEEQDHLLEDYQKKKEDFKMQINFLQEKIKVYEMEQDEVEKSNKKELQEKEAIIQALNIRIIEEERKNLELKDQVTATEKLMRELQEQIASMKLELANSKQKERQCSEEIKQLMGTVEDLQKRHHYIDSQFKSDVVQKMVEQEMQKRLEQLRAEMDEMYGQQIVQMKQELIKQHMSQIEELKTQHKEEIESVLKSHLNITINEDQIKLMNVAINELNMKLQDANAQKEKLQEELGIISGEKSTLQRQLDDLFEELNFLRDQIQRARMIIAEQESQLNEAHKSLSTVEALKAEIVLASESRKELELKHEAEVTDYKIKLEMLEKGKNAALDRMAESQEAELERLRTQLLFNHEEELSKLKDDLEVEHRINIEKLKDSLGIHYKQKIDGLQNEMSQKMETMQFEKDNLITKQNQLVLEISKLKDLQKSIMDSKSEEMTLQMHVEFALQKTNNRLLKILLEVVKTAIVVEETIGHHVLGILDRSSKGEASVKSGIHEEHIRVIDRSIPSYSGSGMPRTDNSMCSKVTEEGTELSQHLIRIGFAGTEIDPENEELMLNISSRLQAAVEKMLEALSETSSQEQAIDREHERDVFQQEIQKLEQQLKVVPRIQPVGEHQTREVEQLTKDLKEKTDKCSELLLSKEQLQRDVQERNEEIEKLEFRVRELEQALLVSTDNFQKVEDQKQFGALEAKAELSLEVQLQAEQDAIDRKEKEITNLEEQLEQFRDELENKNEEVQQLHVQLEIQKKESTTRLQELEQENNLFKDEMEKLRFAIMDPEAISTHDQHMLFGKFAQIIQEKEVKIDRLNEQIRDFHQQLRLTTDNKDFEEKNELIRDLEAQIECLKSDQERLKKNREEETDKLNEVIEKLQEELSYIKQNMLLDTNSPSEQEDSLKHQLEKVIAEKLALEQQVEITNEEMAFTKNVLKETNFKMDQLTQELVNLKREHDHKEKIQSIPDESVSMTIDDLSKDHPELEVIHIEDVLKPPENKMYLRSFEESTEVSRNLETKLLQLESSVSTKDLELIQCYKQIEDIKEQGQSETEMLQKKIVNLQKVLEEKVAAALVSQVQLEAVQEYVKFYQDKGIASSELEKENMQNLNQITENKMESDMSALTLRISDLERQVIEMHTTLISEKEQVETAEKNALEKEKKLIELQKLLEDSKKKLEGKERKRSPHGDFVLKTTTELINASGESGFFEELEALRIQLVATKEELATFKETTEKLQKELLVKETNMASLQRDLSQVKNQLVEEKKKLSHFLIKEDKSEVPTNRNICLEPLPIIVGKNTASQTDQILKVNMSNQTPQILVKNAGIQIDIQTSCSSEKVSEIIRQFTERIEHIKELHATEILDMESRHISETETLKKEHYVAVELLTEACGTLKAVIQCLRPKEGSLIPELMYSNAYKTREIYSSDSASDWSQGVYLTQNQGFDTASEGQGEEGENITESFPEKIKGLLRSVHNEGLQVLSLTESLCGEREDHSIQQISEFWLEERRSYLNIISSLKDLITKIQVQRESEVLYCIQIQLQRR
ncbi:A-kinase anchor protein 9-like isoform 3-T3 [Callospermophilus lateralis]